MASLAVAQEEIDESPYSKADFKKLASQAQKNEMDRLKELLETRGAVIDDAQFKKGTKKVQEKTYTYLIGLWEQLPPQSPAYDPNQPPGDDPVPMNLEQGAGKEDEGKEVDFVADDNIAYFPPFIPNAAVNSNAQNNEMGAQNIQAAPVPEQGDAPIEINLSENINPPPQTSAIMNAFSQAESNDKFAEAFTRMRTGMAIHRRQEGRDDLRPRRDGILEHIARRMENATNFYNTSQDIVVSSNTKDDWDLGFSSSKKASRVSSRLKPRQVETQLQAIYFFSNFCSLRSKVFTLAASFEFLR